MSRRGWTAEQYAAYRAQVKTGAAASRDTEQAVDNFTSSVESLLIAVSQRGMTPAQMDRLAAILQRAELDLLRRSRRRRAAATAGADPAPEKAA